MLNWKVSLVAAAFGVGLVSNSFAVMPDAYIHTMDIEPGVQEAELLLGSAASQPGSNNDAAAVAYGRSINSFWKTKLYANFIGTSDDNRLSDVRWENTFRLTHPGQYWVDVGLLAAVARGTSGSGVDTETGILLQKDVGRMQFNLNYLLNRPVATHESEHTTSAYEAQFRYKTNYVVDWGVQLFGDGGRWNFNSFGPGDRGQEIGPAIFGSHHLVSGGNLKYNAAILLKMSGNVPDHIVRGQLSYNW